MMNVKYVASALVLTTLLGFSTHTLADEKHKDAQPVPMDAAGRRASDADLLKAKKYTLLKDTVFFKSFSTKITQLDGTELKDQSIGGKESLATLEKFMKMTESLRLTLAGCRDQSDELLAQLLDKHMLFLVDSFYDQTGQDMKKDADKHFDSKFMSTMIWTVEAYFNKQKTKFNHAEMNKWNKDYLDVAKAAFKVLGKEDYTLDKWKARRTAIETVTDKSSQAEKELAQSIKDAETAFAKLELSESACLVTAKPEAPVEPVKPPTTPPAVTPTPTPTPTPSTSPKPERVALTPAPPLGNGGAAPSPTPTVTATPTPPPTGGGQQPPLVDPNANQAVPPNAVADNALAGLENDINDDLRGKEDELRRLQDLLNDQLAEIDRLNRDRNALLNDRNNNDNALADALRALGQQNENPLIPPQQAQVQPPQQQEEEDDDTPIQTPEQFPQEPQQPQLAQQPPQAPPPPQIVTSSDRDKNSNGNLFDDLYKKRDLPGVTDQQLALKTLQDLMQSNRELADQRNMMMQQQGMYPGGNSVAARMGQGRNVGRPVGRTMNNRQARSGQQNQMALNPNARGNAVPSSLKARTGAIR